MTTEIFSRVKYTGATPGADGNTYVLFSTVAANFPAGAFALTGTHRFLLDLAHSHLGTLSWYRSDDRGTSWIQQGTEAIAAPPATETTVRDYLVESCKDWKLVWVNGGAAQTTWAPDMAMIPDRHPA